MSTEGDTHTHTLTFSPTIDFDFLSAPGLQTDVVLFDFYTHATLDLVSLCLNFRPLCFLFSHADVFQQNIPSEY